jgi:DNA mismatch endonuclease (patch repair protein)
MRANRSDSSVEQALRSALHTRGLRFRKHLQPIAGLRCKPDVVFTRARLAVFVDGCFWHSCPEHATRPVANADWWREKLEENVARDRRNDAALTAAGWHVVRLWEHQPVPEMVEEVVLALAVAGAGTLGGS